MTPKLRVFFDGGCPMCRKEISIYRDADASGDITWCDVSTDQPENPLPLARDVLLARFHVQTPNGQLISGARGFIEMWRHLPRWRFLAMACSVPGLPVLLEFCYRGFLKIRPTIQKIFR